MLTRCQILKDTKLEKDFPMVELAQRTEGCSGSDLKELCRNAAMLPMRELMPKAAGNKTELSRMRQVSLVIPCICFPI